MQELGIILLTNAATATLLGIAVACVARRLRAPAAVHALWVVVLLDLLAPPVLEVGLLPVDLIVPAAVEETAVLESEAPIELDFGASRRSLRPAPVIVAPQARSLFREVGRWIPAVWFAGFAGAVGLALVRTRRFTRMVRGARPAPTALQARLAALAGQAGLCNVPRLCVVRACLPPMLRWRRGHLEILFPLALLRRLEPAERDALLLHELAHVRRRDAWVRVLELAAACFFWWHPLVFWARRSLRRAEEMSCDAWVLRWLPGHGRAYAQGLLETLEFLSGSGSRVPALASGAGDFRGLEERLTMIVKENRPSTLPRSVRWALALAAVAVLLVFPIAASRTGRPAGMDDADAQMAAAPPAEREQLAQEMQSLQDRQQALQQKIAHQQQVREPHELQQRAAALDARSIDAEVEAREKVLAFKSQLVAEADALAHHQRELRESRRDLGQELERRAAELRLAHASDKTAAALELHRVQLDRERRELESQGRIAEATRLERQMAELDRARQSAEEGGERAGLDAALDTLRQAVDELRGIARERAALDRELQRALEEVERSLRELR